MRHWSRKPRSLASLRRTGPRARHARHRQHVEWMKQAWNRMFDVEFEKYLASLAVGDVETRTP